MLTRACFPGSSLPPPSQDCAGCRCQNNKRVESTRACSPVMQSWLLGALFSPARLIVQHLKAYTNCPCLGEALPTPALL